jgi:DNA-directed RNA polymerase specialized sigma subunit
MGDYKNNFKIFVEEMNQVLDSNEVEDGRNQKQLLEELFKLETEFRDILVASPEGPHIYRKFIDFIITEKGNILSARVYFRERQDTFSSNISSAFQNNRHSQLFKFGINYLFAKWVCDRYVMSKKLRDLLKEIIRVRKTLCENNLPLAINRAKIFWSKVPASNLEYMDIIQNAAEGLINAIDKFVPPYKTVFKSVAIGRMSLNILTDHNATLVKFSPRDRRILYRANNARTKAKLTDMNDILAYVNESFHNITREKLEAILNSASGAVRTIVNDENEDEQESVLNSIATPDQDAEIDLINQDFSKKISTFLCQLPIIERKIIKLRMSLTDD